MCLVFSVLYFSFPLLLHGLIHGRLLCRLDLSQFDWLCKWKQRTIAKFWKVALCYIFMLISTAKAVLVVPAFLICWLWEASYPTTNLVSQTNFKVLKNSQNLDLLGLNQLLRIHLLCSQNFQVNFASRHKRIDQIFLFNVHLSKCLVVRFCCE